MARRRGSKNHGRGKGRDKESENRKESPPVHLPLWSHLIAWGLVVALVGLMVVNGLFAFKHLDQLKPVHSGQLATDFELPTLSGDRVRLSDLRGKPVLFIFWSVYCGVCHRELKLLAKIRRDHPEAVFLAIHSAGASRAEIADRASELDFGFPVLIDNGAVAAAYRVRQFPELVLVDRKGQVSKVWIGYTGRSDIESALAQAAR